MLLALGLTLVLYASLQAEENSFTINSIHMESLPSWEVMNGQQLTLECLVDISTTSKSRSQHRVLFYKDDAMVYNVTSREHTESYVIPQARVFHSGKYKCIVQVTHLVQEFTEIIIQKDKAIVATSKQSSEAVYSVMAMVEYSGHYTCKVESNRISKASSIMVNITELFPKPKLEFSSSRLDQGELLDLSCSVSGTPVANFTIQKEETVLSQYQNFSKIAEESDSGEYSCTAGIGKVVKRSGLVPIQVCEMLSKPSIFHDAKSEIIKGHAIGISCQSENGTAPITYHLMKAKSDFQTLEVTSNDPATFTDKQ